MKRSTVVLMGLLGLASASVAAQSTRENASARISGDSMAVAKLVGVFQNHDKANRLLRISDADYAVDPVLLSKQGDTLRSLRQGQTVIIELSGYDTKGRDVIVGIQAK
jgi:hypothetical protein